MCIMFLYFGTWVWLLNTHTKHFPNPFLHCIMLLYLRTYARLLNIHTKYFPNPLLYRKPTKFDVIWTRDPRLERESLNNGSHYLYSNKHLVIFYFLFARWQMIKWMLLAYHWPSNIDLLVCYRTSKTFLSMYSPDDK